MSAKRREAAILLVLWSAASCTALRTNETRGQTAQFRNYKFNPSDVPSTPPPWPRFRADDYRKPGNPTLTKSETQLIRAALRLVKPCQVRFLRYAFPSGQPVHHMVLFFASDRGWPHVLWTRNLFYKPEDGTEFAGSATFPIPRHFGEITYDIQHTDCQGKPI